MPLPHDIYVDEEHGSDTADGSKEHPLASLRSALEIREGRYLGDLPVRIFHAHYTPMGRRWSEPFDEANPEAAAAVRKALGLDPLWPLGKNPELQGSSADLRRNYHD